MNLNDEVSNDGGDGWGVIASRRYEAGGGAAEEVVGDEEGGTGGWVNGG
jgi:hypothetical protein